VGIKPGTHHGSEVDDDVVNRSSLRLVDPPHPRKGRMPMIRRTTVGVVIAVLLAVVPATAVIAAPNPSGSGQPGAECGDDNATSEPGGFGTGGFETAESSYAGSDGTHSLISGNAHAVSQYDVACYQVTSAGH
jgi:hypothetical protein